MKKKHIIFISIIVVIIISGIVAYVLKNNKAFAVNNTNQIVLYTIPEREKVFVNGVITPEKTDNIFLDSTKGRVDKILITDGQVVKKGDTLFTYKNDQIVDQIDQLNNQITSEKKQLLDMQEEAKNQSVQTEAVSQTSDTNVQMSSYANQISSLQTQINTNQDQINTLKEKEFATVFASIGGKVFLSDSQKDLTKPFIVIETTSFYIKGSINEKDQPKLKANQSANILVFSTNKTVTGKITSIGDRPTTAEISTQAVASGSSNSVSNYDVNISIDSQENITNGFHVQATVYLTEDGIKIPKSSIFEEAGKKYVFKVVDKKLTKQEITYEQSTSTNVVVHTGLKENDSIAANTKDMKEGMSVE